MTGHDSLENPQSGTSNCGQELVALMLEVIAEYEGHIMRKKPPSSPSTMKCNKPSNPASRMVSWLFDAVRRLHDRLLMLGNPLRGGITIGGMHWDHTWSSKTEVNDAVPVAFGPGLVSAYDLGNGVAIYPRILISDKLYDHVCNPKLKVYPLGTGSLQDYCCQDADGLYHLDVLHHSVLRKDTIEIIPSTDEQGREILKRVAVETPYDEWLNTVREFIQSQLIAVKGENLLAKYRWLARYYNHCVQRSGVGTPLRIFQDEIPAEGIPLTIKEKKKTSKK